MKIGIAIEETWDFLHDIYKDLSKHHEVRLFNRRMLKVPVFYERTNKRIFQRDLKQLLTQNDVVFFEWASELLLAASKLPKTCGIVTRLHRYEMYQWVDQINWAAVDKIILVSKAKRDEFIQRFPQHAEKVAVIFEGVSLEKFPFRPKPYGGDIGILCHLTPRKRVYELILDFYELTQQDSHFHLHIGGDTHPSHHDYMEAMQDAVRKLGIQNRITFYGPVSNTSDWYKNIDIFISNSYSEGLQVALLEAMASGCYCLSHQWAGVDELLPSENLYFTGSTLNAKLRAFDQKTDEEKQALKSSMRDLVAKHCDMENIKKQIRLVIESSSGAKPS